MRRLFPIGAFLIVLCGAHFALAQGDYDDGVAAAERGDIDAARAIWEPLAASGDARAQYRLGMLYSVGRGVTSNFDKATGLFSQAAEQGHVDAQFALGLMYERGQGVDKDMTQAWRLYRAAAEGGHPDAQYFIGAASITGDGLEVNEPEGAKWMHAAAEGGHPDAILTLGVLYALGRAVSRDPETSYMWFKISEALELQGAVEALERARIGLSEDQISAAEARAAKWLSERE